MVKKYAINLTVNGINYEKEVEARKLLVDFIREDIGLTGTHIGCEHGQCGACTVVFNGKSLKSCLMFAVQADGAEILTVEGLAKDEKLHPIQEAFWENHGLQCGYCTPGVLMSSYVLLKENPQPSEEDIREGITGNICRCTGYVNIVKAIKEASKKMGGLGYERA